MGRQLRPLLAVGLVVLAAGFAVGIAFANVSVGHVVLGMAVLACLAITLFLLGRRRRSERSDKHDHDTTLNMH